MIYKTIKEINEARFALSPPGDTLQTILDDRSMSQIDLARRMNKHKKTINEIIKGHASITPETAIELENTLNIPADFWLERDRRYQLHLAEINEAEKIIREKEWASGFPLLEMKKYAFIENERDLVSTTKNLYLFFGITSEEAFNGVYSNLYTQYSAFRISDKHKVNRNAIIAWLRRGEKQAEDILVKEFDTKKVNELIPIFKEIMVNQEDFFFDELQLLCSECGIRLVHTPKLPKAPVNGATRWYRNNPLLQLSNRYQRNDIFWFTFFHELGHIVKHGKKDVFLEGFEYTPEGLEKEKEADAFAVKCTYSNEESAYLKKLPQINKQIIIDYADKLNTHPAIIIGRIAHESNKDEKKYLNMIGWQEGFFKKIVFD